MKPQTLSLRGPIIDRALPTDLLAPEAPATLQVAVSEVHCLAVDEGTGQLVFLCVGYRNDGTYYVSSWNKSNPRFDVAQNQQNWTVTP